MKERAASTSTLRPKSFYFHCDSDEIIELSIMYCVYEHREKGWFHRCHCRHLVVICQITTTTMKYTVKLLCIEYGISILRHFILPPTPFRQSNVSWHNKHNTCKYCDISDSSDGNLSNDRQCFAISQTLFSVCAWAWEV